MSDECLVKKLKCVTKIVDDINNKSFQSVDEDNMIRSLIFSHFLFY